MSDEQDPPVGYKQPPKHSQFRKGGPQPQRRKKADKTIDVRALLSKPMTIGDGAGTRKVHSFELSLTSICQKAIKGDMRAAATAMDYFYRYGVIGIHDDAKEWPSRLEVPVDYDYDEWMANYELLGPPPWPFEHDGISRLQELRDAVGR